MENDNIVFECPDCNAKHLLPWGQMRREFRLELANELINIIDQVAPGEFEFKITNKREVKIK